jgi:hypothetical protein
MVIAATVAVWLYSTPSAPHIRQTAATAPAQVLTWTANDSVTSYASAPTTATSGPATIVFENSTNTGNTMGMPHTLTFDTSTPGYNHDVNINITASPYDANKGRYEVQANLTAGKYRYFCSMPGHQMTGELVVTDGSGTDTTPPQVSASVSGTKDAGGNYVGSATVTISAQDTESGVASVQYALDTQSYAAYTGPLTVNQPGAHTVLYRATDKAGNTSTPGSVQFTVVTPPPADTTPPQVSASVSGTKDASGNYVGSATVTITAQDSQSGVASVEYSLDQAAFTAYSGPVSVNLPGNHTLRFRATDKAGNTSPVSSVQFTVVAPPPADTTPPDVSASVSGTKDASGSYVGSATVTITATDSGSGVATVDYSLDGQAYAAYTGPLTVNQPGGHTVRYRATDKAGNTSTVGTASFTVVTPPPPDTTPPQVSASVSGTKDASGNYVGSATVAISAQDTGSGVASVQYALDTQSYAAYTGPLAVNQPGAHTVQYRATDKAGNTSPVGSVQFTVVAPPSGDTTPPQVSAGVTGSQDWAWNYVGSAIVTITATDSGSGVASVEYSLDGQLYAAYTGPLTVNQPGHHTVQYRATDKAGNTSTAGTASFAVVKKSSQCSKEDTKHHCAD